MKNKAGTAYVSKDGVHTIIININAKENSTKAGLIGTLAEEASHIVNGVAGRQIATGTEEKGLESTGRAANAYFKEEYKGSNQNMTYRSDGKIDTSKLGANVGDACITIINGCMKEKGHISRAALGNPGFMNFINKVSQAVPKVVSFAVDFSPAGTLKGGIEAVTGKDMLTGEEVNLLSRVLGALPFVKPAYRGAKATIKIVKSSKKAEVVLSDGSKIALKSDGVVKFENKAKNVNKTSNVLKDLKSETIMKRFNATVDNGNKGKGFKVNGSYEKALQDFYSLNPKNIKKIPKPNGKEMIIGTINIGGKEVTVNVRNFSSKLSDNEPTLELLEKGKSNSKKIRYLKK